MLSNNWGCAPALVGYILAVTASEFPGNGGTAGEEMGSTEVTVEEQQHRLSKLTGLGHRGTWHVPGRWRRTWGRVQRALVKA